MGGVSELLVEEMIQVVQLIKPHTYFQTFKTQVLLVVKDPTAKAGDTTDTGSVPGWGRSPGEGNGNPLQYSCLEIPMDWEPGRFQFMGHKESDTIDPTDTYTHICLIQEKAEVRIVVTVQDRVRENMWRTSLGVQWTRIHLPIQRTLL